MLSSEIIIDVTEADFQYEVVQYSRHKPVVVDFWAEWCGPCKTLGPLLEHIAEDADGQFRLAKVNVDNNPNLAMRFNVRGIPAVKGFRMGNVVNEFVGVQPEPKIREFLRELAPSATDLTLNKGESQLRDHDWEEAERAFRQVLDKRPEENAALLGLAKSLLAQNQAEEALDILDNFPDGREYAAAQKLLPLAKALRDTEVDPSDVDLEATYLRALRLIKMGNFAAAMDGLLDLLRKNKRYRDGEAHRIMLALFELLGADSKMTIQYQRELANVLF